ncbi:MAG: hypothetical protein AB7R89_06895 [Dehalococcoidia bacterium]
MSNEELRKRLTDQLQSYLQNETTPLDLYLVAAEFDWGRRDTDSLALRPLIGRIELLTEEIAEEIRDEAELRDFAFDALQQLDPVVAEPSSVDNEGQPSRLA